jgi:uncharacterized repeat protein (TIGR03803 family)
MEKNVALVRRASMTKRIGCLVILFCAAAVSSQSQTFKTIHSFDGTDGFNSQSPLIQGTDGNLYGTMPDGGPFGENGFGTVFRMTPNGELTTLYSFCSQAGCTDGSYPYAALIQATDGNFYGTTYNGGTKGYGTVFRMTPAGTLSTIHSFCSERACADGALPRGSLVQATDGNFYGTTQLNTPVKSGGTVFKMTPSGTVTTLYTFCTESGCPDGELPGTIIQATDGNFYGTTLYGGTGAFCTVEGGCGTAFKITPSGVFTTLHNFCSESSCVDGEYAYTALIQASDGNFYGTTDQGGISTQCYVGCGNIYKIAPNGRFTNVYSFCKSDGYCTDGAFSQGSLIQATDGNLYGPTRQGGAKQGDGTLFSATTGGKLTTLYRFNSSNAGHYSGIYPYPALVQYTDGSFYGTTFQGGPSEYGTVFTLSTGLGPFVETQTSAGTVGATVNILGTDLTGAMAVSFNGFSAIFAVVSSSFITATVPAGATTGFLTVTTPGGILTSNKVFRIVP